MLHAPDQMQPPTAPPKTMKNIRAKTQLQWKTSPKTTKGKLSLKKTTMMSVNPKYVRDQPMLTLDQLREASPYCVDFHKYYIQNYKSSEEIIVQFQDRHFLVGDDIFVITFFDLYDLFNLDVLNISLMRYFAL
jgi:hypothetical protein